jgi:putative transcriptional regulator
MKNQLRLLRAERSWSQAELAQRLGVSRQTVNAIETGKYDPSLPLAFQMADLFGLLIEEIFHPDAGGTFAAMKRLEKDPREEEELVRAGRERLP